MTDPNLTKSPCAALLDGDTAASALSDEDLMGAYAEFVLTECALPPAHAVAKEMHARKLDKPVKITLHPAQAVRLAYLFDRVPWLSLGEDEEKLSSALEMLAFDEYHQLPYQFYTETDGWRGRAAASQGQAI